MGLRSAAKEISIQGLKLAPSGSDMPDKPKPQAVPALNLSLVGTAKGKERGDLQTDKEVISYLEQIDIANRGREEQ